MGKTSRKTQRAVRRVQADCLTSRVSAYGSRLQNITDDPEVAIKRHSAPEKLSQVWCSSRFMVQLYNEPNGVIRLSINRCKVGFGDRTFEDGISWEEMQQIKAEVGYGDCYAIEVYPRDCDVVNDCNLRHLWILPEPLPIGWVCDQNQPIEKL